MSELDQTPGDGTPAAVAPELESARKEAARFGWRPQEEWEGDPTAWVDADKFLARGKEYNGFLKRQNEQLQGQIDELRDTLTSLQNHHTKVAQASYEKALKDLKESRKQALRDGDLPLVAELEEHIERAESEAPQTPTPTDNSSEAQMKRDFDAWVAENPWYQQNEVARFVAEGVGKKFQGKYVGRAFLDKVAEGVREKMPELFANPNRTAPGAVDSGTSRGAPVSGRKTYNDLPPEAKKECDRLTKRLMGDGKPVMTKEQYLKEYFELEGEE